MVALLFVLEAGIHATIAGVSRRFAVPVKRSPRGVVRQEEPDLGPAPALEHRFRPISNGLAIQVFAFFAAGVAVGGVMSTLTDPVAIGTGLGWVLGKLIGIFSAA